jgi:hypothetical protein
MTAKIQFHPGECFLAKFNAIPTVIQNGPGKPFHELLKCISLPVFSVPSVLTLFAQFKQSVPHTGHRCNRASRKIYLFSGIFNSKESR